MARLAQLRAQYILPAACSCVAGPSAPVLVWAEVGLYTVMSPAASATVEQQLQHRREGDGDIKALCPEYIGRVRTFATRLFCL